MTGTSCLRWRAAPDLPLARLVVGQPTERAGEMLPRLFALCRAAQGAAVRAALGQEADTAGIAAEILRDHLQRLFVIWPRLLGLSPLPMPARDDPGLRHAVFGPSGRVPAMPGDMDRFLASGAGVAPVLRAIGAAFAGGIASAELPAVTPATIWERRAMDNSPAARHAGAACLSGLGHGPLRRAAARLCDIDAALAGNLPPILRQGTMAVVPAARGAYALRIETKDGKVCDFARVTPTDHLLAPGGVLERSLAGLPADAEDRALLLLAVLDPCVAVTLDHAEPADA